VPKVGIRHRRYNKKRQSDAFGAVALGVRQIKEETVSFENIGEAIGFWGGLASIVALVVMGAGYFRGVLSRIREKQRENEQRYSELEQEITFLTQKATTHQQRQDVYMYANSLLSNGRNLEMRIRITSGVLHIISFSVAAVAFAIIKYKDEFNYIDTESGVIIFKSGLGFLILGLLVANTMLIRVTARLAKFNDSFYKGFITVIDGHIEKRFNS